MVEVSNTVTQLPLLQLSTHEIKVSEELALTDSTGLHLGAGPYMLIYSRETEEHDVKSEWPKTFKVCRKHMSHESHH